MSAINIGGIAIFAVATIALNIGGFETATSADARNLFYYSLINITANGLGNIYPSGHLQLITRIASLTGFLIISCTAQFVFQMMQQQ